MEAVYIRYIYNMEYIYINDTESIFCGRLQNTLFYGQSIQRPALVWSAIPAQAEPAREGYEQAVLSEPSGIE